MSSSIYSGSIVHARKGQPDHRFAYGLRTLLIDLDEIDQLEAGHRFFSREHPNLMSFRRADYYGDPQRPLAECIRDLVEERLCLRPEGRILQLAHVRTIGWLFNPIAVYYCYERTGATVIAVVAVVTNTPWKESHAYVMPGIGTHRVAKELHVSPFFGMDQTYEITITEPAEYLRIRIITEEAGATVLRVDLALHQLDLTRRSLRSMVLVHPLATVAVSARIHLQAARLWIAGATFHRHPRSARAAARVS